MTQIELWGDGSADNKKNLEEEAGGGIGVVLICGEYRKELSEYFSGKQTNNTMELMAVIRGLENIKTTNIPILVRSDSSYVVNCFIQKWHVNWRKNGWKNSKKKPVENKELWIRLLDLVEKQEDITFKHVKGHAGNELNELCDTLAKQAVERAKQNNG
ncbi:ribonuclease HI [Bacillus cereus]|uniref:ribonuclease H family protein n=1 Tax=Bacillus thuringiensis TaxID=1428 RepID=UPI000B443AF6|nr:ribonuclease H [Bacillus thuringiensis]MEB9469480.1 ribonuclease HI [Bacillus cereus]OUA18955.1 ribonuclease HI [Bacillus thuringiensis serovar aizawai]